MKQNKLMTTLMMLVAVMTAASVANAAEAKIEAGKYAVDPAHTKVGFEISHLVISTVDGRFNKFSGDVDMNKKIEDTKINASIDVASIDTGNADRDNHLKSPDFFDAAKYPTITFKSTKVSNTGDKLKVVGDLTIHGVTKSVALEGKYKGVVNDPFGFTRVAYAVSTKISRKDFGLTWSKAVEAGPVVGDEVTITLNVEANKPIAKK